MLYRRRDFRPDKQPRLLSNFVWKWSMDGYTCRELKPRPASKRRQDYKHEHNNRQRTHDRKVVERELTEWIEEGSDGQSS